MSRKFPVVAVVCLLLAVPRAVAEDAKYVKLVNADSGKVLSIENDSKEAEARAVLVKDENGRDEAGRDEAGAYPRTGGSRAGAGRRLHRRFVRRTSRARHALLRGNGPE